MAILGYCQLIAPEALPEAFWHTESNEDERESGDEQVAHRVRCLEQSTLTYEACWLLYEFIDSDFVRGRVVAMSEQDFARGRVFPALDVRRRAVSLPIYFTAAQLHAVLAVEPHPLAPAAPGSAQLHIVKDDTRQSEAHAKAARTTQARKKVPVQPSARLERSSVVEIVVPARIINRVEKYSPEERPGAYRLSRWLVHFALEALVQMQQSVRDLLERRRLQQQERELRAVLRERKPFHAFVVDAGASGKRGSHIIQVNVFSYQAAA